ncbi:4'-phosphopantetheinyl transferase family protein [Nioella aestuarii]|uniref:4'-phosphopantetheinyl transferase family protein n=1 Tax=Nioella aestuarii TaxID=1662864 RepID=UPI003D7F9CBB
MFGDLIEAGWRGSMLGYGEARVGDGHDFWPGESRALARATPARQAEFAAGRAAARQAFRAIGMVPYAIPMGADRAPVWPNGIVGSITHHEGRCMAVIARRSVLAGLGLDLAALDPLAEDLWPAVLTEVDRNWLSMQEKSLRGGYAQVIFSAKEATYKALYPQSRRVVGFDAMDIVPDLARNRFTAVLRIPFGPYPAGSSLLGQVFCRDGLICTLMALPISGECGGIVAKNAELEMQCFQPETV